MQRNVHYGVFKKHLRICSLQRGKTPNPKKMEALVKMRILETPQEIQIFNGMAQFYICFIKKFASVMIPIT
jgi:hypothetical protein